MISALYQALERSRKRRQIREAALMCLMLEDQIDSGRLALKVWEKKRDRAIRELLLIERPNVLLKVMQ